jgi:hypothetical protein
VHTSDKIISSGDKKNYCKKSSGDNIRFIVAEEEKFQDKSKITAAGDSPMGLEDPELLS